MASWSKAETGARAARARQESGRRGGAKRRRSGRESPARASLYGEVTARIVAELEAGRCPWVQPWDNAKAAPGMPRNAATRRPYSGINILILWSALVARGHADQCWLTFRQARALGGTVRKGEQGVTVYYADRFTPLSERARAEREGDAPRAIAFLKRFTLFNIAQCEGLAETLPPLVDTAPRAPLPAAERLIAASGADIRIGGPTACYSPSGDFVVVPPQSAFFAPVDYYRTALHELGHWTGHASRLGRDQKGGFGSPSYAREELVAELCAAFTCAALGIAPTLRHADYLGHWLDVLNADERAIFKAASQASRASDMLLGFAPDARAPT